MDEDGILTAELAQRYILYVSVLQIFHKHYLY